MIILSYSTACEYFGIMKTRNEDPGRALFAGGCFWGVEYYLSKLDGVLTATSGYCGGFLANPHYEDVCSHTSGHLETVEVYYNPDVLPFRELAKVFFEIHDPEQENGQGPDIGPQYLSAIFPVNTFQKNIAEELIALLNEKGFKVATQLLDPTTFWPAEEYHQNYYARKGSLPYCHKRVRRFND